MFELEVKVEAFSSKDLTGRKIYTKGRVFKWNVEYGSMTLDLLLKSLTNELNLCNNQTPTVWFYDKRLKEDARLVDEIQMLDFFEMYKEEMKCHVVVAVFDRAVCVESEFDDLEPLFVVPPVVDPINESHMQPEREEEAAASNPKEPTCAAPDKPINEPHMQPEREVEAAASKTKEPNSADEIEPDREPDIFDNEEEYVGVNDEGLYGTVPPAPHFEQPTDNVNTNNERVVHAEDEVNDNDPLVVTVLHDPEHPKIVKGQLFPDMTAFRKAVRHFAVATGFEFAVGYKTDTTRFTAKCAAEGCPWRIHASTIFDKKTV